MFRKEFVPLLAAAAAMLWTAAAPAAPLSATQYGDFDRYVLALSWQTGFCQSQHDRRQREPDECRLQKESDNKDDFLTVHGRTRSRRSPLDALRLCHPAHPQHAGSPRWAEVRQRRNWPFAGERSEA